MEDSLSSDIEVVSILSNVELVPLFSEVDDDYRTLVYRITEISELRELENNEPRLLE